MPDNDLHKPLGLDKKPAPPRRRIVGVVMSGALGCAAVVAFVALRGIGAAPDAPQAVAAIVPASTASAASGCASANGLDRACNQHHAQRRRNRAR